MFTKYKEMALHLRRKGNTFSEINMLLEAKIPKSTLSTWFKNINLTPRQKTILDKNITDILTKSRKKAFKINRDKRIKYLKALKNKNLFLLESLDKNTQKLLLAILYLGEGAKSKSTGFLSLASSNPRIIRLYLTLLSSCFTIDMR